MRAYVQCGSDSCSVIPALPTAARTSNVCTTYCPPEDGWKDIKQCTGGAALYFNSCNIVNYFISRTLKDGFPAGDFKAINKSAEYLFRCGHVQKIEVSCSSQCYIRANCLPEMKKDRIYKLSLVLNKDSFDITYAHCGCPAGKGPMGSCKHIAALCYGVAEFCNLKGIPEYQTCTDRLQAWNQPRKKKVDPIPVDELGNRRRELLQMSATSTSSVMFDPRPMEYRTRDDDATENLRCDLLNMKQKCAFTTILIPSVAKIQHDHRYSSTSSVKGTSYSVEPAPLNCPLTEMEQQALSVSIIDSLCLSETERLELEMKTREQSSSLLWFQERRKRITGSKCGRILIQQQRTPALLRFCLYPKPFDKVPEAIAWGQSCEPKAFSEYIRFMNLNGHGGLFAKKSGLVVHPDKGWLGASPDAWVFDPTTQNSRGIAEFKCPFSKAEMQPEEACSDQRFYCSLIDGKLFLKRIHSYYHQVQLQLYVCGEMSAWCDFCMYTSKGILVERIYPDKKWQETDAIKLDNYFMDHILKELVYPTQKPSYYL